MRLCARNKIDTIALTPSPPSLPPPLLLSPRRRRNSDRHRARAARRRPQIPSHQNRAREKQRPAHKPHKIIGLDGDHNLRERILDFAEFVQTQPRQSLRDARPPHRQNVKHHPRQREPKMPIRRPRARQRPPRQARREKIQRAESHKRVPAKRARMHMADRPIGEMAHDIDAFNRHHRAFECRQSVKRQRQHDEFERRLGAQFLPRPRHRHNPVHHRRPRRREQNNAHHHAEVLHPIGNRGIMQMVRPGPNVSVNKSPKSDNRQAITPNGTPRLLGQKIIHHPQKAAGQKESDRVVAIPPLHNRVARAGVNRIRFENTPTGKASEFTTCSIVSTMMSAP